MFPFIIMAPRWSFRLPSFGGAARGVGGSVPVSRGVGGARGAGQLSAGSKWTRAGAAAAGLGAVGAITVTAVMIDSAREGAANDGKTYNITLLKNKDATGTIVSCQFSPSIEPNGVVIDDSITIAGTGTSLDGKDYNITTKTTSHSTLEFDAGKRLDAEVNDKGTFVLHTSFENHMDDEANDIGSGVGGFFSNIFDGLFGGLFGDNAGVAGWGMVACCIMSCCMAILFLLLK